MKRWSCLVFLAVVMMTAPVQSQPQRNARQVLNLFNDICLATIGDSFAGASEKARELGFRTEAAASYIELNAPGFSGGWSRTTTPRNEKYCEIGSTTANRLELARLIEQRLRQNTGREPRRVVHPLADAVAWSIPYQGKRLYYTVTVGFNDDPRIGATAQITFHLSRP